MADAAELTAVAFPTLSDADLEEIGTCPRTRKERWADGQPIFRTGDANVPFFIVVSGGIEILDESGAAPRVIVTHHRGQFTGEIGWLTGARAIAAGVARGDTETFAVGQEACARSSTRARRSAT